MFLKIVTRGPYIVTQWVSLFNGMERWNGTVEWNDGMEWSGMEWPHPFNAKNAVNNLYLRCIASFPDPLSISQLLLGDQGPKDEAIRCTKIQLDH